MPAWCIKYPSIHMHLNSFYLFKDTVVNYALAYPRASFIVKWQLLSTSSWCSLCIISIIYSRSEANDGFLCPRLGLWFLHRNHQRPWCFQGHWKASLRQGDGQAGAIPGQGLWSSPAGSCGMGPSVEERHHTAYDPTAPSTLGLCSNHREILTEICWKRSTSWQNNVAALSCANKYDQVFPGQGGYQGLGLQLQPGDTHCDSPVLPGHSHQPSLAGNEATIVEER